MSSASDDDRNGDNGHSTPNSITQEVMEEDVEDDLFGDNDDEEVEAAPRQLDDEDLDSGDDEGRNDRAVDFDQPGPEPQQEDLNTVEVDLGRHPLPQPSDGEGYLLKVPQFLSIDPVSFTLDAFQPPLTDHHEVTASQNFSAYKTAQTTIRWRHSPSNPTELQSNARILRWSDGSLTLQLASDPTVQYEIQPKALAPAQRNPPKPTPISNPTRRVEEWREKADQFTYLASGSLEHFLVRVTNKITCSLQVNSTGDTKDEALERLQTSMAAARGPTHGIVNLETSIQDPEAVRRQVEAAEKMKERAQRRAENQANRERERTGRGVGRTGGRGMGLSVAGLEDETGGTRRAPKKGAPRRRRNDEYSDEEEEFGSGYRGNQDEYDMDDGFLAQSDEEEDLDAEGEEDDDDMDRLIERREKEQRTERIGTPKRDRAVAGGDDADEDDGDKDSPVSRHKRRRVVDDEDDE